MTDRWAKLLAALDGQKPWSEQYFLFRDCCMALTGHDARLWTRVQGYIGARAWESAAVHAIPRPFGLIGLRAETDGWIAIVSDGRSTYQSGRVRGSIGLAVLEAALIAAQWADMERTGGIESHA